MTEQSTELEGLKLQFEAFLAEYKMVRDQIANYRQMQGQLDSISLAALGLSIPLVLAILEKGADAVGTILLLPILFCAIAYTQLRHENLLLVSALYVDAELRPQIDRLLSRLSKGDVSAFGFEKYLSQRSWSPNLMVEWIATASRAILGLSISVGVALLYFYIQSISIRASWNAYEVWLLVLDALMLTGNLIIALSIARERHSYFKQRHYVGTRAKPGPQ